MVIEPESPYQCRICGAGDATRYQTREMMYGSREPFTYFQCRQCGCLQIARIPDDIGRFYPSDYYSFQAPRKKKGGLSRMRRVARRRYAIERKGIFGGLLYFAKKPNAILRLYGDLGVKLSDRILDVGCGAGNSVRDLQEIGCDGALGVDPFIGQDIYDESRLVVKKAEITEIQEVFDLIVFHHSFEHLPNPAEVLAHCRKITATGGRVLIRVPTVTSQAWETYRENWVQLDAPRHLFLHSHDSLRHLAGNADFKIDRISCDSDTFQFWGSEQYQRDIALCEEQSYTPERIAGSIFSKDDIERFEAEAARLNAALRGDQICVVMIPTSTNNDS